MIRYLIIDLIQFVFELIDVVTWDFYCLLKISNDSSFLHDYKCLHQIIDCKEPLDDLDDSDLCLQVDCDDDLQVYCPRNFNASIIDVASFYG